MWLATPRPTSVSVRSGPARLTGRDTELDAIVAVLRSRPAAVLIEGEPGMGRTRLLAEIGRRKEFDGGRVLTGACQPLREPFPYGPVLEALRAVGDAPLGPLSPVAGVLRPLLPELAEALPPRPEPLADPVAERHRVFRAMRELLAACGPALVLIDDLQWADEDTRDFLRFLAGTMPPELAVVATHRSATEPGTVPRGAPFRTDPAVHSARVALGALDVAAVRELAVDLLELPRVTDDFAAKLHECTAGIPFVVEETLRALKEAADRLPVGEVLSDRLLENLEVPLPLREAVTERLAALPGPAVRLAGAAAVLGVGAEADVLGELAGLSGDTLRTALLDTLSGGVLGEVGDGKYGFRHPLARKAVYDTVSGPERALLHAQAIRVLAAQPSPPLTLLARHSRAAGRVDQWRHYAEAAADEAITRGETSRAIDLLQSVLAEPGPAQADIGRVAGKLSQVALRGFRPEVLGTLQRVLEEVTLPPSVRGSIRLSLGMLLVRTIGGLGRGRLEVERAVGELTDRPDLAARGITLLAQPIDGLTPLSWHESWRARAGEVYERLDDPELRLALTADRIAAASHVGDGSAWAEFEALSDTVGTVAERVQLARLWCNLADGQSWAGHLDRAERLVTEGVRRATDAGALYAIGLIQGTRVRLDWVRGRWTGLAEAAEQLRDSYPELGPIVMESSLVLGGLAAVRGEFAAAQRHLTAASVHAPDRGPIPVVLSAAGVLISVLLATDDVDGACAAADTAVAAAGRKGVWIWAAALVPAAAQAYARAGRWPEADNVVEAFARGIEGRDAPVAAAALVAGRAVLLEARGKHLAAATLYDEAVSGYAALPMPYPATAMRERASMCRLAAGNRSAVDELTAAAEAYEQLGATRDAGRCRHQLREHGAWAPSQRGRRGYGSELSPREREVARMLAEGRTNREIADGLFLSPRTVEQHVAKVLRKLGARSRTDVARKLPGEVTTAPAG
ncbi:ATP-binding protein [Amycolatopsis sp. NPDC058278]|uniref:ATP-binding protein n=1 Tax=Amycolatopsis sp. NPDC058278 TaxID=3346417 RepID=UPI0036DAF727